MRELPAAHMLLHPRGIRHLVDPSALQQAVLDIYGPEAVARDYGTLLPVPAERITATDDGMAVLLGLFALGPVFVKKFRAGRAAKA